MYDITTLHGWFGALCLVVVGLLLLIAAVVLVALPACLAAGLVAWLWRGCVGRERN